MYYLKWLQGGKKEGPLFNGDPRDFYLPFKCYSRNCEKVWKVIRKKSFTELILYAWREMPSGFSIFQCLERCFIVLPSSLILQGEKKRKISSDRFLSLQLSKAKVGAFSFHRETGLTGSLSGTVRAIFHVLTTHKQSPQGLTWLWEPNRIDQSHTQKNICTWMPSLRFCLAWLGLLVFHFSFWLSIRVHLGFFLFHWLSMISIY